MLFTYDEVSVWKENDVYIPYMPFTKEEGLDIITDTLHIILPYLALMPVVCTSIDISLKDKLTTGNGGELHGRTRTFYCKERKAVVTSIDLNRTSLLNTDALISTLLHEMSHLLHGQTLSGCLSQTVADCGGHDTKFCEINSMLVMMFRLDLRSMCMVIEPDSGVFDVSRFVTYNMIPKRIHSTESLKRTKRSRRTPNMKESTGITTKHSSAYNIY